MCHKIDIPSKSITIAPYKLPLLWILFRSGRSGRNISYQYANRNDDPPCSTSGRISAHSGPFRSFRYVSVNTSQNWRFGRYEFWTSFSPKSNVWIEPHVFQKFFFDLLWLSSSQFKTLKKKIQVRLVDEFE